jgi:hypothetical protein
MRRKWRASKKNAVVPAIPPKIPLAGFMVYGIQILPADRKTFRKRNKTHTHTKIEELLLLHTF